MPEENKTEEKEKKPDIVKGSFVTMDEIVEMKAMKLKGYSIAKIERESSRNRKTVERSLALFEKMLPDAVDMKNRVLDKVEEMQEQMMKNAKEIVFAADMQVMKTIGLEETSAMDAAKIRQIYGNDLMKMIGIAGYGQVDDSDHSPKVQNFITNIINIKQEQKDDRPKPTTGAEEATGGDDAGGEKTIIEGIVSK
jgi:hypothetical protein